MSVLHTAVLDALEIPESDRSHAEDELPTGPGRRRARETRAAFEAASRHLADALITGNTTGAITARRQMQDAFEALYRAHREAMRQEDMRIERARRRR